MLAQVSVRIDEDTKRGAELALDQIGMSMSTAINVFLKKIAREKRIPFELSADPDPFYNPENIKHLENIIADIQNGQAHFAEHELVEAL